MVGLAWTILVWSSNNIVAKVIMREASPLMVALLRFTLAGMLFYLPVFLILHRGPRRFSRSEWARVALLGVAGTTGSLVLYLIGLRTTPATEAGIYQITTPLFVVLMAWLLLGERLSGGRLIGVLLAAGGAAVLVTGGGAIGLGGGDLAGSLFILGSNVTWAGYTLLSKSLLARRSPLLLLAAANLVAALAIWPLAGLLGTWAELPSLLHWSPTAWLIMFYLVAFMSTSSQWVYVWSLRELRASQASAFLYLMPFFTAIMAAVLLGELPTPLSVAAGMLILVGVWLVNRPQAPRRRPAPETGAVGAPAIDPDFSQRRS